MKIKTSELIGTALAYAVGIADKRIIRNGIGGSIEVRGRTENGEELPDGFDMWMFWYPQSNWSQGGPIIERERIHLDEGQGVWGALHSYEYSSFGHTPLIAAMRCYVTSQLGDEVEIPDELCLKK